MWLTFATRRRSDMLSARYADAVVGLGLHLPESFVMRGDLRLRAAPGRVAVDERLQGVEHVDRVVEAVRSPVEAQRELPARGARGRRGDEHAAAGTRSRGDEAAELEEADRLVDGRDRDAEALAEIALRAEPVARACVPARDLTLQLAGDRLRARHARCQQGGSVARA